MPPNSQIMVNHLINCSLSTRCPCVVHVGENDEQGTTPGDPNYRGLGDHHRLLHHALVPGRRLDERTRMGIDGTSWHVLESGNEDGGEFFRFEYAVYECINLLR